MHIIFNTILDVNNDGCIWYVWWWCLSCFILIHYDDITRWSHLSPRTFPPSGSGVWHHPSNFETLTPNRILNYSKTLHIEIDFFSLHYSIIRIQYWPQAVRFPSLSKCEHELHSQCLTSRPLTQSISKLDSNQMQFRHQTTLVRVVTTNFNLQSIESMFWELDFDFFVFDFSISMVNKHKIHESSINFQYQKRIFDCSSSYSIVLNHILQNQTIDSQILTSTWS